MKSGSIKQEFNTLAGKYRPLLVLYPEIADGSQRREHYHRGHRIGSTPPLDQDYHPRDIRLILDHARLPDTKGESSREQVLEAMGNNEVDYVDLIDKMGPKDVDKFWRVYAQIKNKDKNPEYHRKAYARIVQGHQRFESYILIQYWLPYFFDDWANVHEMDWEGVSIILKNSETIEEPVACVFNAHAGAFRKPWSQVHKVDDSGNKNPEGLHPVAYIANGSHATYFSDYPTSFNISEHYVGSMLRILIRLAKIGKEFTDYVSKFEEGIKYFPEVEVIPEPDKFGRWSGDWRWLNFKGRWGSPVHLSFQERLIARIPGVRTISKLFERPIREAGPTGPNARIDSCWNQPFDWVNLECIDALETRDWLGKISNTDGNKL